MARPRVEVNSKGVLELLVDGGVRAELARYADEVAARARASAPVKTGEYKESIARESATTDRAVERVVVRAPHGLVVEARTGNLARAIGGGA